MHYRETVNRVNPFVNPLAPVFVFVFNFIFTDIRSTHKSTAMLFCRLTKAGADPKISYVVWCGVI